MQDVKILHLVTGQVVVGSVPTGGAVLAPFELFVTPPADNNVDGTTPVRVSMIPYGTLYGLLPAIPMLTINDNTVIAAIDAPDDVAQRYIEFRNRHLEDMARLKTA
jgi:hypothetical protein